MVADCSGLSYVGVLTFAYMPKYKPSERGCWLGDGCLRLLGVNSTYYVYMHRVWVLYPVCIRPSVACGVIVCGVNLGVNATPPPRGSADPPAKLLDSCVPIRPIRPHSAPSLHTGNALNPNTHEHGPSIRPIDGTFAGRFMHNQEALFLRSGVLVVPHGLFEVSSAALP